MSKKIYTIDGKTEDDKPEAFYSEEMSRAAVGRLFKDREKETEVEAEAEDDTPQVKSAYVTGFEREPLQDTSPTKRRIATKSEDRLRQLAEASKEAEEEEEAEEPTVPQDEAPVERQRRRRPTTTNLLGNEARNDTGRERTTRRNPSPKPAVRVNVAKEQENEHEPDNSGTMESFRSRYSSKEIFSPPRNPSRPTRRGPNPNRSNRPDPMQETASPLTMILAGAAIIVIAIVFVLGFQLMAARNNYSAAQDQIADLNAQIARQHSDSGALILDLENEINSLKNEINELRSGVTQIDTSSTIPNNTDRPSSETGDDPVTPQPPTSSTGTGTVFPVSHVVAARESLSSIAQRYYGNSDDATIRHIATTNNITNINRIQLGQELTLVAMP